MILCSDRVAVEMQRRDFLKTMPGMATLPGMVQMGQMGGAAAAVPMSLFEFGQSFVRGSMGVGAENFLGSLAGIAVPEGSQLERYLGLADSMARKRVHPTADYLPSVAAEKGRENSVIFSLKGLVDKLGMGDQKLTPDQWQGLAQQNSQDFKRGVWSQMRERSPLSFWGLKGKAKDYLKQQVKKTKMWRNKSKKTEEKSEPETQEEVPQQSPQLEQTSEFSETFGPFDWEHGDMSRWSSHRNAAVPSLQHPDDLGVDWVLQTKQEIPGVVTDPEEIPLEFEVEVEGRLGALEGHWRDTGIQKHSVGEIYPWRVVVRGGGRKEDGGVVYVQNDEIGEKSPEFPYEAGEMQGAHQKAEAWAKEQLSKRTARVARGIRRACYRRAARVEVEEIFEGAAFRDNEGDHLTIERVTDREVYGRSNKFDFSRDSKEEVAEQLSQWGFKYLGVD